LKRENKKEESGDDEEGSEDVSGER